MDPENELKQLLALLGPDAKGFLGSGPSSVNVDASRPGVRSIPQVFDLLQGGPEVEAKLEAFFLRRP